jgi:class 3 adenylate cyclase
MDSGPGDEMLLLAVAERDMGAFRTLYERHAWWLAIRLARRCNDRDLVADAIGDTFVAVWQKPRGFRGDDDIAIADLLRAAHPGRGVHPRRAGPARTGDLGDRPGPPPGEATP